MIKPGVNHEKIPSFNKDLKRLLKLLKEPSFAEKVTELVYPFFVDFLKRRKTNYIVISWNRFTGDLVAVESEEDFYLGMFGADLFSYFGVFSIILNEDTSFIDYLKIEEIIKIGFFRQTVNKDNLKDYIHNTLLIEIKKLSEIYVEILVSDNYNALFEREARGLLTPLDVLSKEKQFEVFWSRMSLFKKVELESFRLPKVPLYQSDVEKVKLSFVTENIIVNEPVLYAFDSENQKLVIQEPFARYKEQIDDYLIDLLNSPDQTLKQKSALINLIDSIIYHTLNKKLKSALDEFTNNTFLKLYLTDKLDEMKEDINSSLFFNLLYRDSHEYKIQNLFHESLMPIILNKSRTDFVVFTKPFIMESLVSFFEYLKQKWNEQINSNKNKPNIRKAIFQSELELIRIIKSQIHPEILSEIRAYYKGEHPLL